jgi:hypothetical protein
MNMARYGMIEKADSMSTAIMARDHCWLGVFTMVRMAASGSLRCPLRWPRIAGMAQMPTPRKPR